MAPKLIVFALLGQKIYILEKQIFIIFLKKLDSIELDMKTNKWILTLKYITIKLIDQKKIYSLKEKNSI